MSVCFFSLLHLTSKGVTGFLRLRLLDHNCSVLIVGLEARKTVSIEINMTASGLGDRRPVSTHKGAPRTMAGPHWPRYSVPCLQNVPLSLAVGATPAAVGTLPRSTGICRITPKAAPNHSHYCRFPAYCGIHFSTKGN